MDLQDKVVIVTGATSGIGRATAVELADAGMKVVATGRSRDKLDALVAEVGVEKVYGVAADIADEATPATLIDAAQSTFGRLDAVVSNAGVMEIGSIEEADVEKMCHMVRVNYEAVVRLAYAALRVFKPQGSGHLIHVSSTIAMSPRPTTGVYAGTKRAVEAFSQALRIELAGSGVKIGVIAPGLTDTHLQDHFPEHPAKKMNVTRMPDGHDLARAIRYMLAEPDHVNAAHMMVMPSEQPT